VRYYLLIISLVFSLRITAQNQADSLLRVNNIDIIQDSLKILLKAKFDDSLIIRYEKLLAHVESVIGKSDTLYADVLYKIAWKYHDYGNYGDALKLCKEAITIYKKTLGEKNKKYFDLNNELLLNYQAIGDYEKVNEISKYLIELATKYKLPKELLAMVYFNYHTSLYYMGQYANAIEQLSHANEIYEILKKDFSEFKYHHLLCRVCFGERYLDLGQLKKGLSILISLEKEATEFVDYYGLHYTLALSKAYKLLGEYEKSIALAHECIQSCEKQLGKEHHWYGFRLNNLVEIYIQMGEYRKAIPLAIECVENTAKYLGKYHKDYGAFLNNLAFVYTKLEEYDKALLLYDEIVTNSEKYLGKNYYKYGSNLSNIAVFYDLTNQPNKAFPKFQEIVAFYLDAINQYFISMSEYERENFLKSIDKDFIAARNFFSKYSSMNKISSESLYDMELALKGLILQSSLAVLNAISESKDSTILTKYNELKSYAGRINRELEKPIEKRDKELSYWEESKNQIEAELSRLSFAFRESKKLVNLSWTDVKNSLNEKEAAVEFLSYETGPDSALVKHYAALVVRHNSDLPVLVKLSSEQQLKDLLSPPPGNPLEQVNHIYGSMKAPNTALYQAIWQPLEQALQGAKTVYYAPSGLLHKVSFAALSPATGTYLGERYELRQVGSTGVVTRRKENSISATDRFLLAGGIQYNSDTTSIKFWSYLPGTLEESKGISKTLSSKKHPVKMLLGKEASEASFKQEAPKAEVLHIATHGYFFPDLEQEKEALKKSTKSKGEVLAFRGDTEGWIGNSLYANWNFVQNSNPMRRSGLALAYANDVWTRGLGIESEDGVLTAQELSNTDLRKAKLVVLSACETGLGDIKGSEGVFGLQRGLKQAGAGSLIMSLWRVPDKETSEFMQVFYSNLLSRKDIRKAFVFTQKAMQKKYDPYYWAAFVLVE
jgi:CHAT domain-containing protein